MKGGVGIILEKITFGGSFEIIVTGCKYLSGMVIMVVTYYFRPPING